MVSEKKKKKHGFDNGLASKFIKSLSKELVGDGEQGWILASNPHGLKDGLQKSADSLPPGKLRSTLLLILHQENELNAFISALQQQIKALSVSIHLHGDVVLTASASDRILETLLSSMNNKESSPFSAYYSKHVCSHEDRQIILARDPPLYILWALAAMELTLQDGLSVPMRLASADGVDSSLPSTIVFLLRCLKQWVMGRPSACVAVASLAPLAPMIFKALQQPISRNSGNIKTLQALLKEVLSFIFIVNSKGLFKKVRHVQDAKETLPWVSLFEGFLAVLRASKMGSYISQLEGLTSVEKFKLLFPLASELVEKALKQSDVKISTLADIVKLEFVLIQMILEVKSLRENKKLGEQSMKIGSHLPYKRVGIIAANGVATLHAGLILDALLSDFSATEVLDIDEIELVRFSLFKALIEDHGLIVNSTGDEASPENKIILKDFLKKIAVARKLKSTGRSLGHPNAVEEILTKLRVPARLMDLLITGEVIKDLPDIDSLTGRGVFGWLLRLREVEFQAIVDRISVHGSRDAVKEGKGVSATHAFEQFEPEALFFLDTTGGEKDQVPGQGNDNPKAGKAKGGKRKKRRDGPMLFHRHGHHHVPIEKEGNKDMTDPLSDSSEEDEMVWRAKRQNQGEEEVLAD